jgi:hypothetical protein
VATIQQIRDAIAARVAALEPWRAAQEWGDSIVVSGSAGCAVVEYAGTQYDAAMAGMAHNVLFKVTFLAGKLSDRVARDRLDELCDPTDGSATSARTALNGNLGGVVAFATVTSASEYREFELGGEQPMLGCEFVVEVAPT